LRGRGRERKVAILPRRNPSLPFSERRGGGRGKEERRGLVTNLGVDKKKRKRKVECTLQGTKSAVNRSLKRGGGKRGKVLFSGKGKKEGKVPPKRQNSSRKREAHSGRELINRGITCEEGPRQAKGVGAPVKAAGLAPEEGKKKKGEKKNLIKGKGETSKLLRLAKREKGEGSLQCKKGKRLQFKTLYIKEKKEKGGRHPCSVQMT